MRRAVVSILFVSACLILSAPAADKEKKTEPLRVLVACQKGQLSHYEQYLEKNYHVKCVWAGNGDQKPKKGEKPDKKKAREVTGLEQAMKCDVMLLNLYRVEPSKEQLEYAKKYFAAGKPVVGLRKASHSFQNWLQVDQEVFGAKYGGHFWPNKKAKKQDTMVIDAKGKKSAIIGDFKPFVPGGGLYKYTELAPEVEVLISGGAPGNMMPQVWSRIHKKTGAKIFYARYDPKDLQKDERCRQMIARALFWAAGREMKKKG